MPTPENTERILTLLQNLRGTEPLRQLFWVELNYHRIDAPIEDIPESLNDCLAEAPRRFAAAGRDNDFHIIYARLNTKTPRKTDERRLIAHLQTRFPARTLSLQQSRARPLALRQRQTCPRRTWRTQGTPPLPTHHHRTR